MIELVNFSKNYGSVAAVSDVSFSAKDSKITGLLGANGAGKTTILKAICAIHYATSGSVLVDGISCEDEPLKVKSITGYVSENPRFYENFTVLDFLKFIADIRFAGENSHSYAKNRKDRIEYAVETCSLGEVLSKKIAALSKGYRQRLAFASAIMHDPKILVLDEPVTGLDPVQIQEMRTLIKSMSKDKTILLSTHLMQEVSALCDEVVILTKGKLAATGTPDEILAKSGKTNLEDAFLYFNKI
ncbi:MAG: ABC transporter ATP-binding protein [Spirochaetaceae bacterium]|nr:ABC transporter ATP-binding protein [Spirochaetaceae bacterium]